MVWADANGDWLSVITIAVVSMVFLLADGLYKPFSSPEYMPPFGFPFSIYVLACNSFTDRLVFCFQSLQDFSPLSHHVRVQDV